MIEVHDLVKYHGTLPVLNGVSVQVKRGEVAAVIGPSGGGKSTLLRCINGLDSFRQGRVEVDGIQLHPEGSTPEDNGSLLHLRRKIGMVFQQFNLFPHMSVLENVMCGPRYVLRETRALAEMEAERLLVRVGLQDKMRAMPQQLSGGQQQRVAIARALAMKPDAILFDEPTSALDPRMAAEVLAVIADLARCGQTMIVVTHSMHFARNLAHTIHVMHEGRIVESGPPEDIFTGAKEEVTKEFLEVSGVRG